MTEQIEFENHYFWNCLC